MKRSRKSFRGLTWWLVVIPESKASGLTASSLFKSASNFIILTSKLIPSDIDDSKSVSFQEIQVPGYNYSPMHHVRNDNTTISFNIPIVNRRKVFGNMFELNGFERLRNQETSNLRDEEIFAKNPIGIYSGYGTHRFPLPVVVTKCDFKHKTSEFSNPNGFIEWTDVSITMQYIENTTLFKAYKVWRNVSSIVAPFVKYKEKWEF